ncbi:hypothetical protein [Streptomyces sp. Go40/10]|nr:hypothetical protein [Streptomyces sp. Go40/10]
MPTPLSPPDRTPVGGAGAHLAFPAGRPQAAPAIGAAMNIPEK